jgi:putative transposase
LLSKQATVEWPDIPNHLDREFAIELPNQVWCGDITYIWSGQRWSYLAVVLDLYARRVVGWAMSSSPDADLVVKALDHVWEQRGQPEKVRSGKPVCQPKVPSAALALSNDTKHEPTWHLLGQRTD